MDMDKQHSAEEEAAGGYGTPTPEQETATPVNQQAKPQDQDRHPGSTSEASGEGSASVPSADAELDESNTDSTETGQPFSSEPKGDATGLPDHKSPKDDDEERFDAG
ncbi:hypothetical protein GCM10023063_22330 [Arthrobacter methylotrophus]